MQIVIDIPEDMWEQVTRGYVPLGISKYMKNGIPLPKGHGRLIDADAYREAWFNSRQFEPMLLLDFTPTVIEADKEVKE